MPVLQHVVYMGALGLILFIIIWLDKISLLEGVDEV